jgi:hypothetical protein
LIEAEQRKPNFIQIQKRKKAVLKRISGSGGFELVEEKRARSYRAPGWLKATR